MSESHSTKTCNKCGETKRNNLFYKTQSECKECTKIRVKARYYAKKDMIVAYEKKRAKCPIRKAKALKYQQKRRKAHPEKEIARGRISNAIRSGKLTRTPCIFCGNPDTQAHHDDYSKPLDVKWVCFKCHREKYHGQQCAS